MPFVKEDMVGDSYHWNIPSEHSVFAGQPSRRSFDKLNGDQVLFIINFYSAVSDKSTIKEARKMEDMLTNHLPEDAKSEISAFNWLRSNF